MKIRLILLLSVFLIVMQTNAHVNLVYPIGGETFNSGETINIQWEVVIPHDTQNWDLFYSGDGGTTWEPLMLDISVDSLNYDWTVPDMYTTQGQILVVMDNNGNNYSSISDNFTITTVTEIDEIFDESSLLVYPNPMIEFSTISFANPGNESLNLILFNIKGQVVKEVFGLTSDKVILRRNNLIGGLYFFQLSKQNVIYYTEKITVK